ncbi:MAG: energy transducer TonB [Gammaproteobacteria bacterium]|nr:energy transducer TonB [Gammaproteobacteria bacterium]
MVISIHWMLITWFLHQEIAGGAKTTPPLRMVVRHIQAAPVAASPPQPPPAAATAAVEASEPSPRKPDKPNKPRKRTTPNKSTTVIAAATPAIAAIATPELVTPALAISSTAASEVMTEPLFEEASYHADYLNNPPPSYPLLARRRREQGTVRLSVQVSAAGSVTALSISQSSGYQRLDAAALEAVKKWQFIAAKRNGIAIDSTVSIPLEFRLD